MVVSCAAYNCSKKLIKGSGLSFYKFPLKNEALLKKWVKAIRRENFTPTRNHCICSDHFKEECFLQNYVNIRKLRDDAVPTIFDFTDYSLKSVVKKREVPKTNVLPSALEDTKNKTFSGNNGSTGTNLSHSLLEPAVKKRRTSKAGVFPIPLGDAGSKTLPASNDSTETYFPERLLELQPILKTRQPLKTRVLPRCLRDPNSETFPENNDYTNINSMGHILEPAVKTKRTPKTRTLPSSLEDHGSKTFPANIDSSRTNFQDQVLELTVKTRVAPQIKVSSSPSADAGSETFAANSDSYRNSMVETFATNSDSDGNSMIEMFTMNSDSDGNSLFETFAANSDSDGSSIVETFTMNSDSDGNSVVETFAAKDTDGTETVITFAANNNSDGTGTVETLDQHSYSASSEPSKLQINQNFITTEKKSLSKWRKNLATCNQNCGNQFENIATLKDVISELKTKKLINEKVVSILESCFSDVAPHICQRVKCEKDEFSNSLKSFALTLHFYSPHAYEFVRETFSFPLPHPSTLHRWYNTTDGKPGFTAEAADAIKEMVSQTNYPVYVGIMFSEMSIKKQFDWNDSEFIGYVDYGGVCSIEQNEGREAREALVVMAVGVNVSWKIPIAYFFIDGLTSSERAHIVTNSIHMLEDLKVNVVAVTVDGHASNISMAEELGAKMHVDHLEPFFKNPISGNNIYIILDVCHMLKLLRNLFSFLEVIKDKSGNEVSWHHLVALHDLQTHAGLSLSNKMKRNLVSFSAKKMNGTWAAQVLNTSVAVVLNYLEQELKLKDFFNSEHTAEFCLTFDRLFDIGNCKNPFSKGFKAALRMNNKESWSGFLDKAENYIKGLTDISGKPLYETPRKTPIIGFLCLIKSVRGLFKDLVESEKLQYLPMYKFSQDHIEMLFSMIKSKHGLNNNPTPIEFQTSYKHILANNEVRRKFVGNCVQQDSTSILSWSGRKAIYKVNRPTLDLDPIIFANNRQCDNPCRTSGVPDHDFVIVSTSSTEYTSNIVVYIAVLVSRQVMDKINCSICVESLLSEDCSCINNCDLTIAKNNRGLIFPSKDVIAICKETEKCLRQLVGKDEKQPKGTVSLEIQRNVLEKMMTMNPFADLTEHMFDNVFPENHIVLLMQCVIDMYIKIRYHQAASLHNHQLLKKVIRQQLTKFITFQSHKDV